jgi:hypothetical protein
MRVKLPSQRVDYNSHILYPSIVPSLNHFPLSLWERVRVRVPYSPSG